MDQKKGMNMHKQMASQGLAHGGRVRPPSPGMRTPPMGGGAAGTPVKARPVDRAPAVAMKKGGKC